MQTLLLGQAGYAVSGHEHPHTALEAARQRKYDLVIIDYELPEMNGHQFMQELRKILPQIAIIFVSGSLTLELAIQLSRQGVAGIFNKPANPKTLLEKINETLNRTGASREAALPGRSSNAPLPAARRADSASPFPAATSTPKDPSSSEVAYEPKYFLGQSEAFREFTHRLWKVRDFRAVLLLQGETGTPFEAIARDLAAISIFRDGPVMVCDAAQFETRHLIEVLAPSLLSQDAGTLVITGVESLSADQQKVLQTLLSSRDVFLPFARRFRLVLAAAAHLSDLADSGAFDETLYYKVSSLSVDVPSLRAMREDILLHVRQILDQQATARKSARPTAVSTAAAVWLEEQHWHGNHAELVRTLQLATADSPRELDVPALEAAADKVLSEMGVVPAEAPETPVVVAAEPIRPVAAPTPAAAPTPVVAVAPAAPVAPPIAIAPVPAPITAPTLTMPVLRATAAVPQTGVASVTPAPVSHTSAPFSSAPKHAPSRPSALTARSVFRPASSAYDFSKRLAESLTSAESAA